MVSLSYQNEEAIRQAWIAKMIKDLGYPANLIAIEKQLNTLPHLLLTPKLPKRRVDILVFAQNIHPDYALYPLLMIECKQAALQRKFAEQVLGYNAYVQAPFVAIANADEILVGCLDPNTGLTQFKSGLPSYGALIKAVNIPSS